MLSCELGRNVFVQSCDGKTKKRELLNAFTGLCGGNVLLLFRAINHFSPPCQSLFEELSSLLSLSIVEKRSSLDFHSRQVPLPVPTELNYFVSISPSTREFASKLSSALLLDYRLVSLSKPQWSEVFLCHLIQSGFTRARELVQRLGNLLSFTAELSPTEQISSQGSSLSLSLECVEHCSFFLRFNVEHDGCHSSIASSAV